MEPREIVSGLTDATGRAPGTDAERRAARWLAAQLRTAGRETQLEPVWVRPQWPFVFALHAALGVAGSVVAVSAPAVGLIILAVVTVSLALDLLGLLHVLRRLSPPRATQNVVSGPTASTSRGAQRVVRLIITASYDAPRSGLVHRDGVRRAAAWVQRVGAGRLPGGAGWIVLMLAALTAVAGVRLGGQDAGWVGAVQLVPTAGLIIAVALLLDILLSHPTPGASEPASGAAVACALATALDSDPPEHLGVELVLAGAGDGPSLGMRDYVRTHRRGWAPEATAVIHLEACGRGNPRWWVADGPLVPLRLHPRLTALAAAVAAEHPDLGAAPLRGHWLSGAFRARLARWPAIAVGCRDRDDIAPGARTQADGPAAVDDAAMDAALRFCLALVTALDADLGEARAGRRGQPGPGAQSVPASST